MGTELPNLGFQKSTGNTERKNKCCNDLKGIGTHAKSCRVQPSALCARILPSLPAVILLIALHANAVCWK